jgi:CheY-like chemotaxis protein
MSTSCIVVIDNHPVVRHALATYLGADGSALVFHPGAAGALALIRQVQPRVVLIDLHLEEPQAGLDVVRALRADPATRALPVVVWSTDPDVERQVAALNVGAVTVVSKYDDPATLRAAIAGAAARMDARDDHMPPEHLACCEPGAARGGLDG